jgi:hypothetical protein
MSAAKRWRNTMIRQEGTLLIHGPIEVVFACAANPEQEFLAGKGAIVRPTREGPLEVRTTFQVLAPTPTRGPIETTLEITTYEPNHALGWKQTTPALPRLGIVEMTSSCRFEAVEASTLVTLTIQAERHLVQAEWPGPFKPLSKLAMFWTLPLGVSDGIISSRHKPLIQGSLAALQRKLECQVA